MMFPFCVSGVMGGQERRILVSATDAEHALNQAHNLTCFSDAEFAGLVVEVAFTYNGKARAGQVVEHGDGWVKLDEGQDHPKTFTLAKAVA